jgi:hypothetical protein
MWGFRKLTVGKFDERQVSGMSVLCQSSVVSSRLTEASIFLFSIGTMR